MRNAVRACSGGDDLPQFPIGRNKLKVLSEQPIGFTIRTTLVETYHFPGRLRREVDVDMPRDGQIPAEKTHTTYIWGGGRAWTTVEPGHLREVEPTVPALNMFPAPYLVQLEAALDPNAMLSIGPQTEWHGRPVVSIRVGTADQRNAELIFDADSKLMIGGRRTLSDPATGGATVTTAETEFSDFHDVHGVLLPMSTVSIVNGKRIFDVHVLEFETLPAVDDQLFAGP